MPNLDFPLAGGLDLQSDPTSAPPGTLRDCLNYEVTQKPGYERSLGWMPYDGSLMATELRDFYYMTFLRSNWNTIVPIAGETIRLQVLVGSHIVTANFVCIGSVIYNTSSSDLCAVAFAYAAQNIKTYNNLAGKLIIGINGLTSGFSAAVGLLARSDSFINTAIIGPAPNYLTYTNSYITLLRAIETAQWTMATAVPGSQSPPDATFMLSDNVYAVHDLDVMNFTAGTNANVQLLEGHKLRFVTGFLGTVLQITVTSGDWNAGTAAGYLVLYDRTVGTGSPLSDGQTLAAFSADGTTNLGNVLNYAASGSWLPQDSRARSLLYKTTDISPTTTFSRGAWSRVPLTREIQYAQFRSGSSAGTGFGPVLGAPYSIYEYSRQGLGSVIAQLTPINTAEAACQNASQPAGTSPVWTNLNNIKVDDGAFATFPVTSHGVSLPPKTTTTISAQKFTFTDANGIALPPNITILGIKLRVKWKSSTSASTLTTLQISLIAPDGTVLPANKATSTFATTTNTDYFFGGPSDLWGRTWTLADLSNANFGVALRFQNLSTTTSDTVNVDFVGLTVTYSNPTRVVYVRNDQASSPTDVPLFVVHYTLDNNTDFNSQTGLGTLTVYSTTTEAGGTAAGKTRVITAGEQIRDAPGGGGNLLGYTTGTDVPTSLPCGAALDAQNAKWVWRPYNFYSDPSATTALGANGTEFGVGFDGTYLIRVRTGRRQDLDNPRHVAGYASNTHWGYNSGDVIVSSPGRPFTVAGLSLAQAYNVGRPVTGLETLQFQTLGVFTDRFVYGLQGTDPTNYTQAMISPALGAIEYTVTDVEGSAMWTSFRGVETLQTTNAYGDFSTVPLSQKASPWLQPRLQGDSRVGLQNRRPVYAVGVRNKRQYRLYFADGYVYTQTLYGEQNIPMGTIQANYNFAWQEAQSAPGDNLYVIPNAVVRHVFQGVRSDGKELIFACWEPSNPYLTNSTSSSTTIGYYPYVVRLDAAQAQYSVCSSVPGQDNFYPSYVELNPVYPAAMTDDAAWTQHHQYQSLQLWAAGIGGVLDQSANNAVTSVGVYYTTDFDRPLPLDKFVGIPTTITMNDIPIGITETAFYSDAPIYMQQTNIVAEGEMLRIRFDTGYGTGGGNVYYGTQPARSYPGILYPPRLIRVNVGFDLEEESRN